MSLLSRSHLVVLYIVRHSYFSSLLEIAETKVEAIDQINRLKARIETKCKVLPRQERATASHESLISFQDLEDFPLVVQQW